MMNEYAASLVGPGTKRTRIAVVGASSNPEKMGYRIVQRLVAKGFEVVPVNPGGGEIAGLEVAKTLNDIEGPVDIVNFVVPPAISRATLEALDPREAPVVWLQPGSFDAELAEWAHSRYANVVDDACIMVATAPRTSS